VFFLFVDKLFDSNKTNEPPITYSRAIKIGMFQILAMVPGVSRSAATIIGGLSQNLTKKSAAEFSFFLAVPTMFGATLYSAFDYYKDGFQLTSSQINLLVIGNVVAFIVAMVAIKSFITFLSTHGFKLFGYYRIIVGIAILVLYYSGVSLSIL
jgi:undecaprenyl-diphosphatase